MGFLLGKATSDRHHLTRARQSAILYESQSQQDINKIENDLRNISRKLMSKFNGTDQYLLNNQLEQNFKNCMALTNYDTTLMDLEETVVSLIRDQYKSFLKCADKLKKLLKNV